MKNPTQSLLKQSLLALTFIIGASAMPAMAETAINEKSAITDKPTVNDKSSSTDNQTKAAPAASDTQATPAGTEETAPSPAKVDWPATWTLKVLPGPLTDSGRDLGGKRLRCFNIDDGMLTVIELTYFPRKDKGVSNLTDAIDTVLKDIKAGYEADGHATEIGPVQKSKLSNLEANEAILTVTTPNFKMLQQVILSQSDNYLYSVTYTGRQIQYDKFKPLFEKVRQSMELK